MQREAREWALIDAELVHDYGAFRVRRDRARSPRTGAVHTYHVLELPRCVKVVALTGDGRIVLVSQYRQAARQVTLELPAGRMDEGEDAVTAALRELEEETGFRATEGREIAELWPDPALQGNVVSVVVATGCVHTGSRDLDGGEDIAVRVVAAAEVTELIKRGEIRHAQSIAAWYRYALLSASPSGSP